MIKRFSFIGSKVLARSLVSQASTTNTAIIKNKRLGIRL